MEANIELNGRKVQLDLSSPIDLSRSMKSGSGSSLAFYAPDIQIEPIQVGSFIGSTSQGSSVNTNIIKFNPHGNCTHTESVAHISSLEKPINQVYIKPIMLCYLHSVNPELVGDDLVVKKNSIAHLNFNEMEALILRANPASSCFSGSNPPYIDSGLCDVLVQNNIEHLLTDLPSVDKEEDGGSLFAHKAFWVYDKPNIGPRLNATITELLSIPDINDGWYALTLQVMNLENNAAPSRPILYPLL